MRPLSPHIALNFCSKFLVQAMADRYTYDQFKGLMARSRNVTLAELAQARDYLILILQANNVPYAFMGGYSLVLRGS
jgi:hypothetical protein